MAKLLGGLYLFFSALLYSNISQASIIPPLNGIYALVEQQGNCFSGISNSADKPLKLVLYSTEIKLLPAYMMEDGLRHIINYSMKVGVQDQVVLGDTGIYRKVGEYSPDMRIFTFSEYALPKNPTGLEKPQRVTVFQLDQDEVLTISEVSSGWKCKFVRK
ncbi:MAG: hypothetical protein ACXVCP_15305 [Bdellovibrio sp.]